LQLSGSQRSFCGFMPASLSPAWRIFKDCLSIANAAHRSNSLAYVHPFFGFCFIFLSRISIIYAAALINHWASGLS